MTGAKQLLPGLFLFPDTCNVYVICGEAESIAVDFGSGRWLAQHTRMGLPPLTRVYLTHHHADQCGGLAGERNPKFEIHAPMGEESFLSPAGVRAFHKGHRFPPSYSVLPRGIPRVTYDMAGFNDQFWGRRRIRFLHTPGHGPHAVSIVLDHAGKQIVLCGDAAHADATIHQPYHLEWDHWRDTGAVAAWQGVERLAAVGMDLLCPAHGPVIDQRPRHMLRDLSRNLRAFIEAKGSICAGEKDHYIEPEFTRCGARRILPDLYHFGTNGYLLVSKEREGLIVDPTTGDMPELEALTTELGVRPRVAVSTHFHDDHVNAAPMLRRKHGAKLWLHPLVAKPLADVHKYRVPYLVTRPIRPDGLLPAAGTWRWREYSFRVAHYPGQTWWHCCLMTRVAGKKVLFGGDSFQPASRWNGTGGFSAYNGSRFREGFIRSARLALKWQPDIVAGGHRTYVTFHASQYRKIIHWAGKAESATRALCPSGDLEQDYYLHEMETG